MGKNDYKNSGWFVPDDVYSKLCKALDKINEIELILEANPHLREVFDEASKEWVKNYENNNHKNKQT